MKKVDSGQPSYAKRLHSRAVSDINEMSSEERDRTLQMLGSVQNLPSPDREEAFVELIMYEVREKATRKKKMSFAA